MRVRLSFLAVASFALLASCTDKEAIGGESEAAKSEPAAAPAATGRQITIEMHTDETGNYFKPAEVEAETGDVLRFVLVSGVHNVNFLPDSNPGMSGLPSVSTYAQMPGQAIEIPVTMGTGRYYFQCDPHALLGMVGYMTVK